MKQRDNGSVKVIAPRQQKGTGSRAGQGTLRLWLLGVCGLTIIIGCAFLAHRAWGSSSRSLANGPAKVVPPTVASAPAQVSMLNLQFSPVTIEVKKGDVLEWKNDDLVSHTVTSAAFDSGTIAPGKSWRHTFTKPGDFSYVCTFHPQMKGLVIVK
ncbi:MAG: hypothetical protein JWM16_5764 [Verrucomicrobiales bacterium]|nr:hypothetical protein [Verrucomicrobiales bacterium]